MNKYIIKKLATNALQEYFNSQCNILKKPNGRTIFIIYDYIKYKTKYLC